MPFRQARTSAASAVRVPGPLGPAARLQGASAAARERRKGVRVACCGRGVQPQGGQGM